MKNQTLIIRHYKENKKKCTLQPLVGKENFKFYTYPIKAALPDLSSYVLLTLDAKVPLSEKDSDKGLILIDATWKYADRIYQEHFKDVVIEKRALPSHYKTAYPRRQPDCSDQSRGLASIEALYLAHRLLGQDTSSLFDDYYFGEEFKRINSL